MLILSRAIGEAVVIADRTVATVAVVGREFVDLAIANRRGVPQGTVTLDACELSPVAHGVRALVVEMVNPSRVRLGLEIPDGIQVERAEHCQGESMATVSLPPLQSAPVSDGQRFLLRGVDWASYRKISEALTGRHVRLTYDRGSLEFMTISTIHAILSRLLFQLIVVLTEELGMPRRSCGDMTCDRDDLERGLEPDECFYLTNEPLVRNKEQIDLAVDPPPDLGVEVDITRSSRTRLGIYAALRVPEVWRFDGERLFIHQFQADGQYIEVERSRYFPFLSGADVVRFLQQRTQMDENSLMRSFREWVRVQIHTSGN